MKALRLPVLMGAPMGAMMLTMIHMGQTGGDPALAGAASIAFIAAHLVPLAGVALWGANRFPRLARHLHRPPLAHVGAMLGSAALVAGGLHLIVHGGIA